MRKPVLASVVLLLLALSSFMLGNERQVEALPGYDTPGSGGPNVIRQIILPDSRVSPSYRISNLLGFVFLVGSVTILAADRQNRKREYY